MNTRVKKVLSISGLSFLSSGIIVLLYVLDPKRDGIKIVSLIMGALWVFSLIPAAVFIHGRLKKKSLYESFTLGLMMGMIFGGFALVVPVLFAPVFMFCFYFEALKKKA